MTSVCVCFASAESGRLAAVRGQQTRASVSQCLVGQRDCAIAIAARF